MNKQDILNNIINDSNNIVFFGGAGVSTESGIPDFRSKDGLYNQKYEFPPEIILSHSFFWNNTSEFYRFYFDKMISKDVKPNDCHIKLVELEKKKKLRAIITQNIDNLHEMAGSKNVIHLHGEVANNYCTTCKKFYSLESIIGESVPYCSCGGVIKPDVVLYEEELNNDAMDLAIKYISEADTLIIAGTSLTVFPAAGLVRYFKGNNLILINRDKIDNVRADLVINDSVGKVFKNIECR